MGFEGLAAVQNAPHLKRWGQELELAPNYLREKIGIHCNKEDGFFSTGFNIELLK